MSTAEAIELSAAETLGRGGVFSEMLIARTRQILWIALLAGLTFMALEIALAPRLAGPFVVKCIGLTLTTAALIAVRGPWVIRHAEGVSLAIILGAYGLTAISGIVSPSREYETTAVLFVGGALTTATLLPWGLWPQAVTVGGGATLLGAAALWSDGDLHALPEDPGAAVVIGMALSLVTVREMQRHRLASRRAELEVRALNTQLEQRVADRTAALQAANEQLHALSARLESVREEERTRIAREIHDELGQMLTALKIDIDLLPRQIGRTDADDDRAARVVRQKLAAMSDLAATMIHSVRRISAELRPSVLDDLGLVEAITWQAWEFERRCGVPCTFTCERRSVKLDRSSSTALFRIVQEALTNVARHADAARVTIALREDDGAVWLEVRDDGRGVSDDAAGSPTALGLLGMRERARLLGGEVEIRGVAGCGTTVRARIPQPESASMLSPAMAATGSH